MSLDSSEIPEIFIAVQGCARRGRVVAPRSGLSDESCVQEKDLGASRTFVRVYNSSNVIYNMYHI